MSKWSKVVNHGQKMVDKWSKNSFLTTPPNPVSPAEWLRKYILTRIRIPRVLSRDSDLDSLRPKASTRKKRHECQHGESARKPGPALARHAHLRGAPTAASPPVPRRLGTHTAFLIAERQKAFTTVFAGRAFTTTTLPNISRLPAFVAGLSRVLIMQRPGSVNLPTFFT